MQARDAPIIDRAYYKAARLLGYTYLVGGWSATGPTGTVERHAR